MAGAHTPQAVKPRHQPIRALKRAKQNLIWVLGKIKKYFVNSTSRPLFLVAFILSSFSHSMNLDRLVSATNMISNAGLRRKSLPLHPANFAAALFNAFPAW